MKTENFTLEPVPKKIPKLTEKQHSILSDLALTGLITVQTFRKIAFPAKDGEYLRPKAFGRWSNLVEIYLTENKLPVPWWITKGVPKPNRRLNDIRVCKSTETRPKAAKPRPKLSMWD